MDVHVATDKLLTVKEVAAVLNHSVATTWRRTNDDPDFPKPFKVGGTTRWSLAEISAYIEQAKSERAAAVGGLPS